MKIGLVSTWGERCGVSEYTATLADELFKKYEVNLKIVANYPKDCQVIDDAPNYIRQLFHCPFMTNQTTADVDEIVEFFKDRDVVHFQFETSIYHPSWFSTLLERLKANKTKIILTMHSWGIWHNFNQSLVDRFVTHEPIYSPDISTVISMPVKDYFDVGDGIIPNYNQVCSFGLGRNRDEDIIAALKDVPNVSYVTHYGSTGKWLDELDLIEKIKESWIISLIYPQVGARTSSRAVTVAMGCDRPILCTPTNWFAHVIDCPNLYICKSVDDIRENIKYLINPDNRDKIKDDIENMKIWIQQNERSLDQVIDKHLELYKYVINKE